MRPEVRAAEHLAGRREFDEGGRVAESDEYVTAFGDHLHGALRDVEDLVWVDVFLQEAGRHLFPVEMNQHALAVFIWAVKDAVGVVVKEGDGIVALPRCVVLPGEIGRAIEIFKAIVLAADLPQDVACFSTDAHNGVHITGRDDIIPRVNLVDTVDMKKIKGVPL